MRELKSRHDGREGCFFMAAAATESELKSRSPAPSDAAGLAAGFGGAALGAAAGFGAAAGAGAAAPPETLRAQTFFFGGPARDLQGARLVLPALRGPPPRGARPTMGGSTPR